jgi:hypothetical protein
MAKLLSTLAVSVAFIAVSGCADPAPPKPPPKPPQEPAAVRVPDGALDRGVLEVVLREGPPWLLERVPVEEVLDGGKFVGWRVQELPFDWQGIELQPGDVVTAVNAMPIETPNDFWAAWTSLSVASELKIAYLRDGEAKEMSIPIYGSPSPELAKDMQKRPKRDKPAQESPVQAPPQQNQQYVPAKKKETITIQGEQKPDTDTNTDWSNHPF